MARKIWLFVVAILITLIVVMAVVPEMRLNAEIREARREGLWVTFDDVREGLHVAPGGENAAEILKEVSGIHATSWRERDVKLEQLRRIGTGTYYDTGATTRFDHHLLIQEEIFAPRTTVWQLYSAAGGGLMPKENLLAAARFVRLLGQEPSDGAVQTFVSLSREILAVAKDFKLERQVAQELGPVPDWRRVVFASLPRNLAAIDRQHERWRTSASPLKRFVLTGPFGAAARRDVLRAFRDIKKQLPAGATGTSDAELLTLSSVIRQKVIGYAPDFGNEAGFNFPRADTRLQLLRFEEERLKLLAH